MLKPDWAKPLLANGEKNPKFVEAINGLDTIEGCNFTEEFLVQKNEAGYSLFFFPNHPSKDVYSEGTKHLSGRHIDVFNYVFVDMDLKDKVYATKEEFFQKLSEFPVKPTMVVNSGNGVHAYWKVRNLTRDMYVFSQLALMDHFKTDESVFTVMQLMRLPGSMNTKKHGAYVPAEIVLDQSSNLEYDISDFPESLFMLSPDVVARGQKHLDKLDGKLSIDIPKDANLEELPDSFLDFIQDPKNKHVYDLFHDPKGTYGDRSGADLKLANILLKAGFDRKDALSIIANGEKALSRGAHRFSYAEATVDKVYIEKLNSKFKTVGEINRSADTEKNLGQLVRSTRYFDTDVLGNPWRKRELTGLIAGPGVGKTTVTFKWIKDAIENNPDNDDIYVFFSFEMAVGELTERWNKLVGKESPLAERLYIISNETDSFEPRNIGLQEILEDCTELKKLTGKNIAIVAIDHVGIISRHIDIRKKFTFGIDSEMNSGYGNIKTLSLNRLCSQLKTLCKMVDTHIIALTQTTKEKGVGDLPIGKDGAYGISDYENIMDRIITIWQPLQKVQHETKLRFLAWQYVKIRNKHIADKVHTDERKLLTFDLGTGDLRITTQAEYEEFNRLLPQVQAIREAQMKKKGGGSYSIHVDSTSITAGILKLQTREQPHGMAKVQPH